MSLLKKGDKVIVTAGGNSAKRPNKGKTGTILSVIHGCCPCGSKDKVLVEGLSKVTRHYKARGLNRPAGKVTMEAPISVCNVQYFAEKLGKGVRLIRSTLADGTKVRGYRDPKTKSFVQI